MSPLEAAKDRIQRLHRWLIPEQRYLGWTPYLWLFYLGSFYVEWYFHVPTNPKFALTLLTTAAFLVLYFDGYRHGGRRLLVNIAAIVGLGVAWLPFNPGAMTFFIYAGAFLGSAASVRTATRYLFGIATLLLVEWWAFDLHWSVGAFGPAITLLVGLTNIHYAEVRRKDAQLGRTRQEVRRLATVAERERIARDLHDLLGHTLSVIALKSELAGRLLQRGDPRAREEIGDVERISRDALKQVREAVAGYRSGGLTEELANARLACEAAGIELDAALDEEPLASRQESVLAFVLREAVTNVVRHSGCRHSRIALRRENDSAVLTISDDGGGSTAPAGGGLTGMRRRLESAGGSLDIRVDGGFALTATLPDRPDLAQEQST